MKERLKEKGITLTVLVVTIILLLILATITIRAISGDNGIIRKTGEAVNAYKIAESKEQETLEYLNGELDPKKEINITMESLNDLIDKKIKDQVDQRFNEKVKEKLYPVGSIYISTEETNPSELFGGTWESYGQGRTLVGVGTSDKTFVAGETGGESKHILTVSEMPSHRHEGIFYLNYLPLHLNLGGTTTGYHLENSYIQEKAGYGNELYTAYTGENQAHNNLSPYIVTYMWKRVS